MNWNIVMDTTCWQKQTPDKPLFPDLLWSRPENRAQAGKLLIIGGNLHGFSAAAEAYKIAGSSGIGTARVLLPDSLKKTVGKMFEAGEYAPSTPSGSFAQSALDNYLDLAAWADGVLLAGDFGRNSETYILIEKFLLKFSGQVTITKDAADTICAAPGQIIQRNQTTLVLSLTQLQHLLTAVHFPKSVSVGTPLLQVVQLLHELTLQYPLTVVTNSHHTIIVASDEQVSTTTVNESDFWQVAAATKSAVWWLQNPTKSFEAITTAQTT